MKYSIAALFTGLSLTSASALAQVAPVTAVTAVTASTPVAEPAPARRYTERSSSLLGGVTLETRHPTDALTNASSGARLELEGRFLWSGWAVSPRLSFSGGGASASLAGVRQESVWISAAPALFAGTIRPITERLSLGVLVGYRASLVRTVSGTLSSLAVGHAVALEVPLTIHFARNGFIEPAAFGYWLSETSQWTNSPAATAAVLVGGLTTRFGYTF
jgi:hypothetical protein